MMEAATGPRLRRLARFYKKASSLLAHARQSKRIMFVLQPGPTLGGKNPAATQPPPRSHRKAHPTPARRHGVRVLHPERLAHQVVDEIEFGAFDHFERGRVDDDSRAVALDDQVVGLAALLDVERILKAREAA